MSTVTSSIVPCPALQDSINRYFMTCHLNFTPIELVPFLLSAENSSGIRQVVNPRGGKKRTVELIYDQKVPTSEVTEVSSCDKVCTATTERGNLSTEYTIDCTDGRSIEEKITLSDWNESCRDNNELIYSRMLLLMDTLARAINQKTAGEVNAVIGNWDSSVGDAYTVDVDGFLDLPTFVASTINPNPNAFLDFQLAKQMTEFCNSTAIIGGLDWYRYFKTMEAGCCNDGGQDLATMFARYGQAVMYDKDMAAAFNNDVSVVFQLGSAQLLTYNASQRMNVPGLTEIDWATGSNYYETTVIHPQSGLPMDLVLKNDCGAIHMILTATTKLVALPNDLYAANETMEGVNWITGLKAVNS